MSSACIDGLPARPDIEGIGTRIATYSQLLLSIFTMALTPAARSFDAWWALLVTSLGLQFAAIAQRHDLTLFHALIVSLLAFPIFGMSWVFIFWHWRENAMPREIQIATHIHGFLFVGFGLWIWSTAPTFGQCSELNGRIEFVVFGRSVSPLGWVRILVLVLYSIWGIMFILAAGAALARAIPPIRSRVSRRLSSFHSAHEQRLGDISAFIPSCQGRLVAVTLFNLFTLAYSIWSVESLLFRNVTGLSRAAESSWTFGQISAIILLVGPLFTFARLLRFRLFGSAGVTGTDREGMPLTSPHERSGALAVVNEKDGRQSSVSGSLINKTDSGTSA